LVDKRHVRRDRADFFCTTEEGIKGKRAVDWRLVDEIVPRSQLLEAASKRAQEFASRSIRPSHAAGIELKPLSRSIDNDRISYSHLNIGLDRENSTATITINGPDSSAPRSIEAVRELGCDFWPLTIARELEDAILPQVSDLFRAMKELAEF